MWKSMVFRNKGVFGLSSTPYEGKQETFDPFRPPPRQVWDVPSLSAPRRDLDPRRRRWTEGERGVRVGRKGPVDRTRQMRGHRQTLPRRRRGSLPPNKTSRLAEWTEGFGWSPSKRVFRSLLEQRRLPTPAAPGPTRPVPRLETPNSPETCDDETTGLSGRQAGVKWPLYPKRLVPL